MTKQEMLDRLFAIETALCNARAEMETLAEDCHAEWLGAEDEALEDFWDKCETAIQENADLVRIPEAWIFQIKEGYATIEEAIEGDAAEE